MMRTAPFWLRESGIGARFTEEVTMSMIAVIDARKGLAEILNRAAFDIYGHPHTGRGQEAAAKQTPCCPEGRPKTHAAAVSTTIH